MFIVNLPSLNICMEFDGDQWRVSDAVQGDDTVELSVVTVPNKSFARFIVYFRTMWTIACIKAKQSERVIPLPTPAVGEIDMSFWGFDKEHANLVGAMPFGNPMSYDDGAREYSLEDVLQLFYQCVAWCGNENQYIIGAMQHNYVKVLKLFLKADVTGQCVVLSSDTRRWELTKEEPVGKRVRTKVGISAYIPEEGFEVDAGMLLIGYDLLSNEMTGAFSIALISELPDSVFTKPLVSNVYEEAFDLSTNAMRLLYYLNANPAVPKEKREESQQPGERGELPSATFSVADGTSISCGGSVLVGGGHGTFGVYDVARWLKSACHSYASFASKFDDEVISRNALNVFEEQFGRYRAGDTPSKADVHLPLQAVNGLERWAWSDSGWAQMYGSDATYQDEIVSVVGDIAIHYVDKDVDMTTASWERLLLNTLNSFFLPIRGLAALYYRTAENPDADDETTAVLTIVDPKTMHQVTWSNNTWQVDAIDSYSGEGTTDEFGMLIHCDGTSQVSGRLLAKMLNRMWEEYTALCLKRYDQREELSAQMVYGDYETLKVCVPPSAYNIKPNIRTGFISDIDSPIILYDGKTRICHTERGWAVNNIAGDKTKRVGDIGQYTVGYEPGNVEWGTDFELFIRDLISLVADYTDEVIQAARLLAIDF